jgi:hypothetical protein
MHGRLEAGVTRYCSSSMAAATWPSAKCPQTAPFVAEQESQTALLLVVLSEHLAGLSAGDRFQRETAL